jgi:dynactin complex subunit
MDESPFPSSSSSFLRANASNKQQYGSAYTHASPGLLLDESADFIGASNGSGANMSEINDDEDDHLDKREAVLRLQNGQPGHDQVETKVKQLQLDDRQQESAENNNDVEEQQKQDGDDLQLELTDSERQEARANLREDRLVQERDDLARMNGLLEQAIAGLQSALPRIEVCLSFLRPISNEANAVHPCSASKATLIRHTNSSIRICA